MMVRVGEALLPVLRKDDDGAPLLSHEKRWCLVRDGHLWYHAYPPSKGYWNKKPRSAKEIEWLWSDEIDEKLVDPAPDYSAVEASA